MKHIHTLAKELAPLTKEQYFAKVEACKKKAQQLVISVSCHHRSVCLRGKRHVGGYSHEETIKYFDWNPCTQRMKVSYGFTSNEIPKSVAEEGIFFYLLNDYEAENFYI